MEQVLQDYLCLNLCVYVIKTFELPNAKVATILLCALFFYDVFWVYLSPYLPPPKLTNLPR